MIYLCFGTTKSGSTLAYELTAALLSAAGHSQEKLPYPATSKEARLNFVDGVMRKKGWKSILSDLTASIEPGRIVAIKLHMMPDSELPNFLATGEVMAQAIYRDPRDRVLSLLDAGRESMARGDGGFIKIDSVAAALKAVHKTNRTYNLWAALPNVLSFNYDEVAFRSEAFLGSVAQQLKIPVSSHDISKIVSYVKQKKFIQFNKGIRHRSRQELTTTQYRELTCQYSDFLLTTMKHQLDSVDTAILSQCDEKCGTQGLLTLDGELAKNTPETKTKRTFVVMGCPRGGTSLIAGALYTAGIYMGEITKTNYEDPLFDVAVGDVSKCRSLLEPAIRSRNARHQDWGWKLPNSVYYIDEVLDLLVNPVFLFIYRDPLAIARSSCKHDNRDWRKEKKRLLEVAHFHTAKVRKFQQSLAHSHEFQVEEIQANPDGFIKELSSILECDELSLLGLRAFINPDGGYASSGITRDFVKSFKKKMYLLFQAVRKS